MAGVELETPEIDLDEHADGFKRMVALAVVLVTLFGAVVAYWQAVESNIEDAAAREAQRASISGLGAQVDASAALSADLQISTELDVLLQRQAINAGRGDAFAGDPVSDVHFAAAARFAAAVAVIDELTTVDPADISSIAGDAALRNERPDAEQLHQIVEADKVNDHGGKADAFVAVLTVLAVALFLLGLSLTVDGRNRYVLAAPGVAIALVCVIWAASIGARPVTAVSDASIDAAAEGRRLEATGDFEGAIRAYTAAIRDSPDFAAAFARRASAHFNLGSAQIGQTGFVSLTSDEALDDALADVDRALELGGTTDVISVADAGFFHFLAGNFDRSVQLSRDAIELNEDLAPIWFNLGVAQTAQDDRDGAADSYREGFAVLRESLEIVDVRGILAGARTDLSVLREILDQDELEDVLGLIEDAESRIAEFEMENLGCFDHDCELEADVEGAELEEASITREGSDVFLSVRVAGVAPGTDVGAAWYVRTDESQPFEQAAVGFQPTQVGDDGQLFSSTLASADPACPVAGDYLVRLYAGGEFLGEATGTLVPSPLGERFTAVADRIEGFIACVPEGFVVEESDLSDVDSFSFFRSPEGDLVIGVNVSPGFAIDGIDTLDQARELLSGFIPGGDQIEIVLQATDLEGGFVELVGVGATGVSDGQPIAAALAVGPDSSSRFILVTGSDDPELLREIIGAVTFTGVGPGAG